MPCPSPRSSLLALLSLALLSPVDAMANPVQAIYTDKNSCDPHPTQTLPEELGLGATATGGQPGPFPADEEIFYSTVLTDLGTCGIPGDFDDDWLVSITNLTLTPFEDLFFVANKDTSFDNFDGEIAEFGSEDSGRAMRIDNIAFNKPLLSENINPNLIFEPGETWEFLVLNFTSGLTPKFDSLGVAHPGGASTASIVASPIPEPSTALLMGLGLAGLALRSRNAHRS